VGEVQKQLGDVTILINNAGGYVHSLQSQALLFLI
jgi:NADP-dependent 3-hydroxy acid dehydrogenase YdfG